VNLPALLLATTLTLGGSKIPRPEHPEPQLFRESWLNLNGRWDFLETDDADEASVLARPAFPDTILVPFCRESPLSGLRRRGFVKHAWYRRRFDLPAEWEGKRIFLRFGACDWKTKVWLGAAELGEHVGGSSPFSFEITDLARPEGNVVTVHALDDARSGRQTLGKQARTPESEGIFYTRTTGIWQTVWCEAVGTTFVEALRIFSDVEGSRFLVEPRLDGPRAGLAIRIEVFADGERVGDVEGPAQRVLGPIPVSLSRARRWSLEDPFLHDVVVSLRRGEEEVDRVSSSAGLREVEFDGSVFRLNGEPVFQRLVLDQGFYPDGIWTAPTDDALRRDIELSKAAGFNGARLHQKVFEPRFHHWADRLGYLTWGEGPSFGADYGDPAVALPVLREWIEIVERDRNHPSIVGWCPFNETPPEAGPLQNAVYALVKALDPSRPALETSGWTKSHPNPDVLDAHDYDQDPGRFAARWARTGSEWPLPPRYGIPGAGRPFFVSEFGGIGWIPPGEEGWGYGAQPKTTEEFFARYEGLTAALLGQRFHFGFCYTQLTDVEQERNGIYFYDRRPKFDLARIRAANARRAAVEIAPPRRRERVSWVALVPSAIDAEGPASWKYTTADPGPGWTVADFGDAAWPEGAAGFGRKDGWEERIGTPWTTADLWLRGNFRWDGEPFDAAFLVAHYDNATTVHLNGEEVLALEGWNDRYDAFELGEAFRRALRPGENLLAVRVHQDTGGQFFDAALLLGRER
jgi:hypothetical protein